MRQGHRIRIRWPCLMNDRSRKATAVSCVYLRNLPSSCIPLRISSCPSFISRIPLQALWSFFRISAESTISAVDIATWIAFGTRCSGFNNSFIVFSLLYLFTT